MKKKEILLIISIFLVVLILFSSSYALLFKSDQTDKQSYATGVLSITSEATNNSVTLNNALPMSDTDGASSTPYTFKITNTGNLSYKFNVMLLSTTTENQISAEYIKVKVNDNAPVKLNSLTNGVILSNITLKHEAYVEISLRVWLDESTPNTEIGKSFNAKITTSGEAVYVSGDKSGANSPDLVQGLIPVKYDESSSAWVKADSENADGSWYNYGNKEWANAVLVSDNGYSTTSRNVNITNASDMTETGVKFSSTNAGKKNSTSSSIVTLISPSLNFGAQTFTYSVSSETNDKLTVSLDGELQILDDQAQGYVSGVKTGEYSYSFEDETATSHTFTLTYTKNASVDEGDDIASVTFDVSSDDLTIKIADNSSYPWATNANFMADSFEYDSSTNKFKLVDPYIKYLSSSIVGKYICSDITKTECTTLYKITEASDTSITKVEEYSYGTGIRNTYQNADVGTPIPDANILAYYVWIPRYKYKVWNISKQAGVESNYAYNAYSEGIDIKFENEKENTGTISCTYNYNVDTSNGGVDLSTTTAETCTGSNGQYYTHPAFTFGSDELRGFWISKFEISSSDPSATNGGGNVTNLTVRSLPNVNSWRYIQVSKISTVIQNMQTSSNIYGLSTSRTNTDSHMLTNFEWGAVAYLTNSKYGRCTDGSCTEVTINNCDTYVTGIGANTVSASSSSTTCSTAANQYNGTYGKLASTTGNITGVYDMSGGSYEYVMGNISKVTTGYTFYPSSSSFSSSWYTTDTAKYVTTYAYDSSNYNEQIAYNRGRLGDATAEVVFSTDGSGGWYSDYAFFSYSSYVWFTRGGDCYGRSGTGVFDFNYNNGGNYSGGSGSYYSSRAALVSFGA